MTACDKREQLKVGAHVLTNIIVGLVLGVVLIRDLHCLPAFPASRSHMCGGSLEMKIERRTAITKLYHS